MRMNWGVISESRAENAPGGTAWIHVNLPSCSYASNLWEVCPLIRISQSSCLQIRASDSLVAPRNNLVSVATPIRNCPTCHHFLLRIRETSSKSPSRHEHHLLAFEVIVGFLDRGCRAGCAGSYRNQQFLKEWW